jgi:hypothetical protein
MAIMNTKNLTVLLTVCITILSCAVYITILANSKETNNVIENPLEGIILEIKENTLTNTGMTLMIKNVASNDYAYGSRYQIEKKVGSNWEPVPVPGGSYVWTSEPLMSRTLKGNSIIEEEIKWSHYGELGAGTYRIIKEFTYSTSRDTNSNYFPISAEFTIDLPIRGN